MTADLHKFQFQAIHVDVSGSTALVNYPVNFQPDFWLVVGRLSAGYLVAYVNAGKGPNSARVDKGEIRLPMQADTLTIETVGATGWYSVYAVKNLDGFSVRS